MITLALALINAFKSNRDFNPDQLYVGTVLIDLSLINGVLVVFGGQERRIMMRKSEDVAFLVGGMIGLTIGVLLAGVFMIWFL